MCATHRAACRGHICEGLPWSCLLNTRVRALGAWGSLRRRADAVASTQHGDGLQKRAGDAGGVCAELGGTIGWGA
jgi:hypothetical protein